MLRKKQIFIAVSALLNFNPAYAGTLIGVNDLPGTLPANIGAAAMALSDDGLVMVGAVRLDTFNYRAYQFDSSGKTELAGPEGDQHVFAQAVSSNGNTIVGWSLPTYTSPSAKALVWNNGVLSVLPNLSTSSYAWAVSNDGSVVGGHSLTSGGAWHAVRWINGAAPEDLNGGGFTYSFTRDMDDTGATVVGYGMGTAGYIEEAFRWTAASGMVGLGVLASDVGTGARSRAYGVSADGNVVVGLSEGPDYKQEAFRWTQADGMIGLGALTGGTYSIANDVNADGTVIVGNADKPVPGFSFNGGAAFRWQQGVGMQYVGDWLTANGVTVGSNTFSEAVAVDASGNVVVGKGQINGTTQTYLARVNDGADGGSTGGGSTGGGSTGGGSTGGNGVIGLNDFYGSLATWQQNMNAIAHRYGLTLWGSHHRTLMDTGIANDSGTGMWVTGDYAYHNDSDSKQALGEFGVFHDFNSNLLVGLGLGANGVRQDLSFDGKTKSNGTYGVFEVDYAPTEKRDLIISATALYGRMDAEIRRGYLNGAVLDSSKGDTDTDTSAIRLRIDKHDIAQIANFSLSPYLSYSYLKTNVDAYTETGGGFPVAYDDQDLHIHEWRLGATAKTALSADTDLRLNAEVVSARNKTDAVNGRLLGAGGFAFNFASTSETEAWGRLGVEVDHRFSKSSVLSASVYGANEGNDATTSGSVSLKMAF